MSGYQRMISYLYRYDNGVKGANAGYARIELRGEKCRVTIQLQDSLTVLPEVDFFIQQEEGLQKITAGRLVRNGNGFGARVETRNNQIMNTQYSFSDIDGIILPVSGEVFYATTWKEIVIHTGRSEWEENQEQGIGGESPERRGEERTPEKGLGNENPRRSAKGATPERGLGNKNPKRSVEGGTPEKGLGNENPKRSAEGGTPERGLGNEDPQGNAEKETPERGVEEGRLGNSMGALQPERAADLEASEQPWASGMSAVCEPKESCCEQCPRRQEGKDFGRHILSMFPKMYPFEIENIGECVRLELKDIGCLPVKYWSLAGNPFLLHGYYCYRHLIFTQVGQGTCAVGVPGIYNPDNESRAKECGFGRFQTLSEVRDRQGAFGYWLFYVA